MRKIFSLLALLAAVCCGEPAARAAVAFDAAGTSVCTATSLPATCTTLTVGSGSNRVLLVLINYNTTATLSSPTITWNGTSVGAAVANVYAPASIYVGAAVFCLVNPTSGNQTLSVNFSAGTFVSASIIGVSFTGADQTTPCKNAATSQNQVATTATLSITSATGDIPVALWANGVGDYSSTNGTTFANDAGISGAKGMLANYNTGAASVSMTATASVSETWQAAGVDIAAAAAAAVPPSRALLGVGQ